MADNKLKDIVEKRAQLEKRVEELLARKKAKGATNVDKTIMYKEAQDAIKELKDLDKKHPAARVPGKEYAMQPGEEEEFAGAPGYQEATAKNFGWTSRGLGGKLQPGGLGLKKGGVVKKYAKGGSVSSASSRADGCAQRGKTKGRIV